MEYCFVIEANSAARFHETGTLNDDASARQAAAQFVADLLTDRTDPMSRPGEWSLTVTDTKGRCIRTVDIRIDDTSTARIKSGA